MNDDDWTRWASHVLAELDRLGTEIAALRAEVVEARIEAATLRTRTTLIFGLVGPLVAVIAALTGYLVAR